MKKSRTTDGKKPLVRICAWVEPEIKEEFVRMVRIKYGGMRGGTRIEVARPRTKVQEGQSPFYVHGAIQLWVRVTNVAKSALIPKFTSSLKETLRYAANAVHRTDPTFSAKTKPYTISQFWHHGMWRVQCKRTGVRRMRY